MLTTTFKKVIIISNTNNCYFNNTPIVGKVNFYDVSD